MGQKRESFVESTRKNLTDFRYFLYNSEEGSVLGRTLSGWGRIGLFYLGYYSFLAALFAISLTLTLQSLDEYKPYFQTRMQSPGLMIQPKLKGQGKPSADISYSVNDSNTYTAYVDQMRDFLLHYSDANQTDNTLFRNCEPKDIPGTQTFEGDDIASSCRFPISELGPCGREPYGYSEGKPCILVKVNKIIDWIPVSFNSLNDPNAMVEDSESKAPPLKDVLIKSGISYNPYRMYISCYGNKQEDQIALNGHEGVSAHTKYYPEDHGMPFSFYPYLGNKRQKHYRSPLVAVQFNNVNKNTEIKVACKVYAANIKDLKRTNVGFMDFNIKIEMME